MTERTRRRMKKTWDITKLVMLWGLVLGLAQQAVAIRGELLRQNNSQEATAATVAQNIHDISTVAQHVTKLEKRVSRLERPSRQRTVFGVRPTGADSVTARSPGLGDIARNVITAPFRLIGFVFGGG